MLRKPVIGNKFPFGVDFQKSLFVLLLQDSGFASIVMPHLEPQYFESDVLVWAYSYVIKYRQKYNAIPNLGVLLEEVRSLDPKVRDLYYITLEGLHNADLSSVDYIKDKVIDFIKRNIFTNSFKESRDKYNSGDINSAYDVMMAAMDKIGNNTSWETIDREWFFESFNQRVSDRLSFDPFSDSVSTGIADLDKALGGGLSIGELGIWIAYPKRGKTTLLINHGVQAIRRGLNNTLHFVLEGSRSLVANRYDTIFSQEAYSIVKTGKMTQQLFDNVVREYSMHRRKLIIRGFTERWDYTIEDLALEMKDLKRLYNWEPKLIIMDYGDLLRGRGKYRDETSNQKAAYRDIKSLANRGYAVWTASQAQRPKNDLNTDSAPLSSKNIADDYSKVRVADFIGSINQTQEERQLKQARLYAEMYRDNESGLIIPVYADFSKMTIKGIRGHEQNALYAQQHQLGYKKDFQQTKMII